MSVRTGLDRLLASDLDALRGKRIGVVCHQASIASDLRHILDHLLPGHQQGQFSIGAVFGPQHGIWGHTQDNMIEWEGYRDPRTGLMYHSLYGEHRKPTPMMLRDLDLIVVDLQDVGSRYYTFIWTTFLTMEAAQELGLPVLVLDRPNPIGGTAVEGSGIETDLRSFVGWRSLPHRHGLTIGEAALLFKAREFPQLDLQVIEMEGWNRRLHWPETGLHWALPSPNMPTYDTAIVYPGGCLLEGTQASEGRGTTRPFEIFGAPYVDGSEFCAGLNGAGLPGAHFRPVQFQPTFQKHVGEVCEGAFLHVTDREAYRPVLTGIAILQAFLRHHPNEFRWQVPPYEYVYDKDPIDILLGAQWLREAVENQTPLAQIEERFRAEEADFRAEAERIYLD